MLDSHGAKCFIGAPFQQGRGGVKLQEGDGQEEWMCVEQPDYRRPPVSTDSTVSVIRGYHGRLLKRYKDIELVSF